jgi:hypothetical protein
MNFNENFLNTNDIATSYQNKAFPCNLIKNLYAYA